MTDRSEQIDSILSAAVELPNAHDRAEYIQAACGGDDELQRQVEELVRAYLSAGDFLESPAPGLPPTIDLGVAESAGNRIGRYRLLSQIGEGGFAVVFMAEQGQPVRRRVAVKIIKPGMDSRQVIARFEAERQALAMMDHSNIAKVLDAGTTESGRPYFVMELVKGAPITDYCDEHSLSIEERLTLFSQVCDAVQHAHQKGVIHRDIKPSNVLVRTEDDKPLVKVIDFGIAKATETRLTDMTLFTDFRQLIGTPAYMSPEQAEGSLDIDTRSDVYSLGVLLYELLSGEPPFDPRELKSKAIAEMQRIIREVDPPAPSARLSTLDADTRVTKAKARGFEPERLAQRLRGELDWIVLRALEKDRNRRYRSAAALADDLERYLTNQPVEARPATRGYRFRKFARRNKGLLAALGAVGIVLIGATIVSTWQAVRASRAEEQAVVDSHRAQTVTEFLVQAFRSPDPGRDGRTVTIAEVLDRTASELAGKYQDDPTLKAAILDALSKTYLSLSLYEKSISLSEEALRLRTQSLGDRHPDTLSTMSTLAYAYMCAGKSTASVQLAEQVLKLRQLVLGPVDPETISAMISLSHIYRNAGQPGKAMPMADTAAELFARTLGPEQKDTLRARQEVIAAYGTAMGHGLVASQPLEFEDLLEPMVRNLGEDDPLSLVLMDNIGLSAFRQKRYESAREMWQRTLKLRLAKLGPAHSDTIRTARFLAQLYNERDEPSQASAEIDELLKIAPEDVELQAAKETAVFRMRPFKEMVDDYAERIRTAADGVAFWSPRKVACCELAGNPKLFDAVAQVMPEETALWIGRGQFHLLRNQYSEAASDYARVIESRPLQDEHFEYGCLLLLCGDNAGYQQFCRETLEQNLDLNDGFVAYTLSKLLTLGPAECISPKRLVELATIGSRDRKFWQLQTLGLAHLRGGQLAEAVAVYEESLETKQVNREPGESQYGLAIAYYKLGKTAKAQQMLKQGQKSFKQAKPTRSDEPANLGTGPWVLLNRMAREAEALLGPASSAAKLEQASVGK